MIPTVLIYKKIIVYVIFQRKINGFEVLKNANKPKMQEKNYIEKHMIPREKQCAYLQCA